MTDKELIKELKDEVKFQKRRADKLDDALWELLCEVNKEDRTSGVGSPLRAAQIAAERLLAHLKEKEYEREQEKMESQKDEEVNEKPNVD